MNKKIILLILALSAFALSGCDGQQKQPVLDAGIYKSIDKGEKWNHNVGVASFPKTGSLANTSVLEMYFDPNDQKTIYLTTEGNGIYYSYNSGESWTQSVGLAKGVIQALAIDTKSKCIIYAANTDNLTILKTTDCGRSWENIFWSKEKENQTITALAIQPDNPVIIYAGTSLGYIYKSTDQGASWNPLNTKPLGSKIINIMIDKNDTNIIYLPTEKKGIFKTLDGGLTGWDKPLVFNCESATDTNCKNNLLPNSNFTYRDLIFNPSKPNGLIYASDYGIIKTENGGQTWSTLTLLNPAGKVGIKAIAVNPTDDNELYYITNTTFYKSKDNGKNWSTKKSPTTKPPSSLWLNPTDSKIIYFTVTVPPQK